MNRELTSTGMGWFWDMDPQTFGIFQVIDSVRDGVGDCIGDGVGDSMGDGYRVSVIPISSPYSISSLPVVVVSVCVVTVSQLMNGMYYIVL